MADSRILQFLIEAEDRSKAAIESAQNNINGMMKKVEDMQPAFQKMAIGGGIAFAAISALAISSFKAFADAEATTVISTKSLENSLTSLSAKQLKSQTGFNDVASALNGTMIPAMKKAGDAAIKLGFDDEAAGQSFAKLFSATKNVSEANKEVAIAMDLARYKNISLEEATSKLMLVHAGATKELKVLGIEVTKGATAMQNMDSIMKQTSGSAEEFGKTAEGAMQIIKVSTDNLSESIGGALAPAFKKITDLLIPLVQKFVDWAEKNPDLVANIILVAGAIAGLITVVATIGAVIPAVIAGFALIASTAGLIVIGIVALIAVGVLIWKNWDTISEKAGEVWGYVKTKWSEFWDWVGPYVMGVMRVLLAAMTFGLSEVVISFVQNWDKIKTNTTGFWDWLKPYLQIAVRTMVGIMTLGLSEVALSVYNNWEKIKTGTGEMVSNTINKIKGWAIGIAEGAASMKDKVVTFVSDLWEEIKTTFSEWTSKALEWGSHFVSNFAQGIYDGTVGKLTGAVEGMLNYIKGALGFSTNVNLPSEVWGQHFMENFAGGMNTGMGSVNGAVTNTITSVQKLKGGVEPEIVSLSKIMDGYTTALNDAKKSHADLQKEGVSSIATLSNSIQTKVGEMVTTLAKLKKDYADIFKDEASSTADNRKNLAEAVVASEKTQADLKLQIAQESDANKRGLLQGQLAAEVTAYQANKDLIASIGAEVTEARKFASMTQLQQAIQAFNLEKDKILEIKNERLKSYAEELETAKKKLPEIKELWKERNDKLLQFMSSEISKNSDFKNAVDASNTQVLQLIVALKQLETQQARVGVKMNASISPKMMASGGIVNEPTLAIIGEAGPEAVIPLNKGYGVPNQGSGQTINVTITGNSFFGEDDLLAKVEKQLMGVLKANVKLA